MNIIATNKLFKLVRITNILTRHQQVEQLSSPTRKKNGCPVVNHLGRWQKPCPKACICPKHNPEEYETDCSKPQPVGPPQCIFVKRCCAMHHGPKCTCACCEQCRADGDFQCSLYDIHGPDCPCPKCMEPHDIGCTCRICHPPPIKYRAKSSECDYVACCKTPHDKAPRILALGLKCLCLLQHPTNCKCVDCKECNAKLEKAKRMDADRKLRERKLKKIVTDLATEHGEDCRCIKCIATRQRVDITLCNEHLLRCVCYKEQGRACRCPKCLDCLRRKKFAEITKSEDYW